MQNYCCLNPKIPNMFSKPTAMTGSPRQEPGGQGAGAGGVWRSEEGLVGDDLHLDFDGELDNLVFGCRTVLEGKETRAACMEIVEEAKGKSFQSYFSQVCNMYFSDSVKHISCRKDEAADWGEEKKTENLWEASDSGRGQPHLPEEGHRHHDHEALCWSWAEEDGSWRQGEMNVQYPWNKWLRRDYIPTTILLRKLSTSVGRCLGMLKRRRMMRTKQQWGRRWERLGQKIGRSLDRAGWHMSHKIT